MGTLSEPQIWTLIGVFAAALIGMYSMVSTMFLRVLRTEIGAVGTRIDSLSTEMTIRFEAADGRLDSLRTEMNARFEAVDARFEAADARMDHVERSVDGLDRDVRMLIERLP